MPSTKSWYELASLTKRLPAPLTAIKPGLARSSDKWGNTPLEPSARLVTETGVQKASRRHGTNRSAVGRVRDLDFADLIDDGSGCLDDVAAAG